MNSDKKKWNKTEKDRKNMEKENNNNESETSVKMRHRILIFWSLLNLNEKQTLEILTVVAVMMKKKVLNIR